MPEREDRERFFGAIITAAAYTVAAGSGFGALAAVFTSTAAASTFAQVAAFNLAAGYAYSALAGEQNFSNQINSYDVNQLGSALPTATIYGKTKVGGAVFYQETTNGDNDLHRMIAFADHEIQSFEEIYVDEFEVTTNGEGVVTTAVDQAGETIDRFNTASGASTVCQLREKLGTDNQAFSEIENSTTWDASHTASGIAYLHCTFHFDQSAYPTGAPQIRAVIKGKKVFDPRTSSTAWSDNPALCLRDYLISTGIADSDEIDDTLFSAAANVCDENVTLVAGGTEKRYTCNGSFTSDVDPQKVISSIVDTMAGMVWYSQGKWGCKAAAFTTPVLALTEDDLRSGLSIRTRASRKDGFNKVIGLHRGEETNWQLANFPAITSPTFLNVDAGEESTLEMELPFVASSATAQRIGKIALYRNREQLQINGSFGMRCLNLTVGDLVTLTYDRLGFSSKIFEVVEWSFGLASDMTLQVSMTLQEISSGVFEWNADETAFESNNTTLAPAFSVPPIGLTHEISEIEYNEKITNTLFVTVSCAHPEQIDSVEVQLIRTTKGESDINVMNIVIGILRVVTGLGGSDQFLLQDDPAAQFLADIKNQGTSNLTISDVIPLLRVTTGLENSTAETNYINNTLFATMLANPTKYSNYVTVSPFQEEFVIVNKGDLGVYEFKDIEEGDYTIRARAINAHGVKGPFVER